MNSYTIVDKNLIVNRTIGDAGFIRMGDSIGTVIRYALESE